MGSIKAVWIKLIFLVSKLCFILAECGGKVLGNGTIASPRFPSPYPGNVVCEWIFDTGSLDREATITWTKFDLPAQGKCELGAVSVYGPYSLTPRIYCGQNLPPPVRIAGSVMKVVFVSGPLSGGSAGFSATLSGAKTASDSDAQALPSSVITTNATPLASNSTYAPATTAAPRYHFPGWGLAVICVVCLTLGACLIDLTLCCYFGTGLLFSLVTRGEKRSFDTLPLTQSEQNSYGAV